MRYIDADKFIKRIKQNEKWIMAGIQIKDQYGATKALHDLLDSLEMFETADVKPVVHAKWIASERQRFINLDVAATDENGRPFIKKKLVKTVRYKCSSCNEIFDDNSLYCPNCGADMRGENE